MCVLTGHGCLCPSRCLTRLCSEAWRTSQLKGHFLAAALPIQFKMPSGLSGTFPPTRQGLACSLTAPAQGSCVEKPRKALGTWLLASDLGMEPRCQAGHPRLLPGRVLDTQVERSGKCRGTPTLSRELRWKLAPSFGAHPSAGTHIFKARAGGRVPC